MDKKIDKTIKHLKINNFYVKYASNGENAKKIILNMIPHNTVIGVGDSATLRQIQILDELEYQGNKVVNPFKKELTRDESKPHLMEEMYRKALTSDVFLVGTNAVTLDGKLVNIDMVGNRVAAMIYGPKRVLVLIGKNKIVKDVEDGIYRIKNIIAPYHAKKLEQKTPCAITGECSDCSSSERICNITTILEKKPSGSNMTIILIDEDLGLSWETTWSEERITRIKSNYNSVSIW
jgi:L-lactate utilization protein LutB